MSHDFGSIRPGFYSGTLPPEGGKPALCSFLHLNGMFETASCTVLAAAPTAVIPFILGGSNEIIMLVPFLSHYLSHYFPNGSYIYLEVPFDVAMHRTICSYTCAQEDHVTRIKSHLAHNGHVFMFFSDHSDEDSGWLFAGKEKGSFVAMSVSQVLSTVLGPYSGVLQGTMMVFLVCGSVVAHDNSFGELQQTIVTIIPVLEEKSKVPVISATIPKLSALEPLFSHMLLLFSPMHSRTFTNFLLALAEQVIVEQLDISKALPGLLALSSRLGQHNKVILMIREDAHSVHNLLITQFCPLCGSTNSWLMKVAVWAAHESQEPDVQDQAPVSRYLYACAYPECGKVQNKSSYKFHIDKPPGFLVNAAKTKSSNWFQSPSTTFPPSLMSLPASCGPSDTKGKCPRSRDGETRLDASYLQDNISAQNNSKDEMVELPKTLKKIYSISKAIRRYYRQFLTDEDNIQAEEEFLEDEPDNEKFGLSPEEREAAAHYGKHNKKRTTQSSESRNIIKQKTVIQTGTDSGERET
ncbi:hypothetical protein F4604DRAFT_1677403 [Suillus subluteus]|nr:hypothetical protein F4604DRAFT_1677403 [Suillus subluteus]